MMTVELFLPTGFDRGRELAERMLMELLAEESAPEAVQAAARELVHVIAHRPDVWVTGGSDEPRYLVRVTVPGSWNTNQFCAYVIPKITDIVADFADDPERLRRRPHCVVQIVGLREHSVGMLGRVTTSTDITRLMTDGHEVDTTRAPEGMAIDPVCGMAVDLATATITLTHYGTTYAFCAPVCRKVFAEDHAIPV
jgi:YHS domain-containing protein